MAACPPHESVVEMQLSSLMGGRARLVAVCLRLLILKRH